MLLALLLQAAACPATPAPLPPELAGWLPARLATANAAGDQPLSVGHGAAAALRPSGEVTLAVPVGRPPAAGTSSGVFAFTVGAAGRYRVALDNAAWVDVVRDGKAVATAAHAHGLACSPVRKMVDYDLQPGSYRLQVVGSPTPTMTLMIAKLP